MESIRLLDNGKIIPELGHRHTFSVELREALVTNVFNGNEVIKGESRGINVEFTFPKACQLLDFIEMRHGTNNSIQLLLKLPSAQDPSAYKPYKITYLPGR